MGENNAKIIDGLCYFIDSKGENFHRLSKNICVSSNCFNKITKNKGSIGADIVQKIVLFHKNLNADACFEEMCQKANVNELVIHNH
jgi:hypothetical protein